MNSVIPTEATTRRVNALRSIKLLSYESPARRATGVQCTLLQPSSTGEHWPAFFALCYVRHLGRAQTEASTSARACSTLNLLTGIAFCPSWMRRSHASGRALDETGAADRDMPAQGQDPAPGSAAHDFGHCLATSERGQVARHSG